MSSGFRRCRADAGRKPRRVKPSKASLRRARKLWKSTAAARPWTRAFSPPPKLSSTMRFALRHPEILGGPAWAVRRGQPASMTHCRKKKRPSLCWAASQSLPSTRKPLSAGWPPGAFATAQGACLSAAKSSRPREDHRFPEAFSGQAAWKQRMTNPFDGLTALVVEDDGLAR
jgi:hypothetical protein